MSFDSDRRRGTNLAGAVLVAVLTGVLAMGGSVVTVLLSAQSTTADTVRQINAKSDQLAKQLAQQSDLSQSQFLRGQRIKQYSDFDTKAVLAEQCIAYLWNEVEFGRKNDLINLKKLNTKINDCDNKSEALYQLIGPLSLVGPGGVATDAQRLAEGISTASNTLYSYIDVVVNHKANRPSIARKYQRQFEPIHKMEGHLVDRMHNFLFKNIVG